MGDWTPRIVMLLLLGVILGVPVAFRPEAAQPPAGALRLVIITPHNEQIRHEIERAFSEWHLNEFGKSVVIDWRAMGGTSDIERILRSGYSALDDPDAGIGFDVVFGGGDYSFNHVLKKAAKEQSVLAAIDFDDAFIADVYGEPMIADKQLYDMADRQWWGVVLSSFGIVYNRDLYDSVLRRPYPQTWSDLTGDDLAGWVALADPSHSGSVKVTYDAILQRYGWDKGWATIRRMCANGRYYANTATKVPIDVSAGEAAAGLSIDFYGRFQAEAVGDDRVAYIAPADATVVTPDPVGMLRGTKRPKLAERFVRFLLSREGQAVWCYKSRRTLEAAGVEVPQLYAGPERFELRRPPVRRDMYDDKTLAMMRDPVNPYDLARELEPGTPSYFSMLPVVMQAMAMDQDSLLKQAWATIRRELNPARRAEMERLFDEMPVTGEQLLARYAEWKKDGRVRTRDRLEWTRFFAGNYERIIAMGRP